MHGRLKVKSTAQQEAEKAAQRDEKMKAYQKAMTCILSQRNMPDKFDLQLKMTSGVLLSNPDITVLWNIRRQVLLDLFVKEANKDEMLRKETDLTQQCLAANPKSYGAWHHRQWCQLAMTQPDWHRELNLCNRYLQMDERNFHCWDYRRFVIMKSSDKFCVQDELDFSTDSINTNFSNYSSWHYRSKLLTLDDGLSENVRRRELEMVQNAAFTDPDDSSAWFYHKWLLGRADNVLKPVLLCRGDYEVILVTSWPCGKEKIQLEGQDVDVEFRSASGNEFDCLWRIKKLDGFDGGKVVKVTVNGYSLESDRGVEVVMDDGAELEETTGKVLEQELQNCRELFELEPESKWTLYTMLLIMHTVSPQRYYDEIVQGFDKLCCIDPARKGYYMDQRSKIVIERGLKVYFRDGMSCLDLSGLRITAVYYKERMALVEKIDLSDNKLKSVDAMLPYLVKCKELVLDNNDIETINGLKQLEGLQKLSISKNPLCDCTAEMDKLSKWL